MGATWTFFFEALFFVDGGFKNFEPLFVFRDHEVAAFLDDVLAFFEKVLVRLVSFFRIAVLIGVKECDQCQGQRQLTR